MKQGLLLLCLAVAFIMPAHATDWQQKTDTIWPARHYRELNGEAIGSQNTKAWIDWKHAEGTVLVYGIHFPTGHVRADAVFKEVMALSIPFLKPLESSIFVLCISSLKIISVFINS